MQDTARITLNDTGNLVDVINLVKYFPVRKGIVIQRHVADVKAVDDVSFFIRSGETLGMVGESGCGKTTVARTMLQLYRPTSGTVIFQGQDLSTLKGRASGSLRISKPTYELWQYYWRTSYSSQAYLKQE